MTGRIIYQEHSVRKMYRVKVKIDPNLLETYRDYVKSGLTGSAYLLTDPAATWPATLAVHLPPASGAVK